MLKKNYPQDINRYSGIDQILTEALIIIKPLYYIEPVNQREEKEKFLADRIKNPKFLYREMEYNPEEIVRNLVSVEIPDGNLGKIFLKKKKGILRLNKIVANRGNKDLVRQLTSAVFGFPDKNLIDYASKLLGKLPNVECKKTVPADRVKKTLEDGLKKVNLKEWIVEFSEERLTTVYPGERKITVCRDRKFAKNDPKRLVVHEVGVHVTRAANGFEQPLQIFGIGLPGYMSTGEGMALYFEKLTGTSSDEVMRNYAGRVVAVDSLCNNLDFRQTFERLKTYKFTDDQAWGLTVRGHRGGGFVKDHIYLKGYLEVKDFAKKDGDFKNLYVGKVGIKDLPLIKKLLKENFLVKARHLPPFLK